MIEKIAIALNFLWLWFCLAPTLLIIAFLLIRKGARVTTNPISKQTKNLNKLQSHKHNWKHKSWKYPEDAISGEDKTEVLDGGWHTRYHERYECDECGEEKDEFTVALT